VVVVVVVVVGVGVVVGVVVVVVTMNLVVITKRVNLLIREHSVIKNRHSITTTRIIPEKHVL
jgi:hypothetical protein